MTRFRESCFSVKLYCPVPAKPLLIRTIVSDIMKLLEYLSALSSSLASPLIPYNSLSYKTFMIIIIKTHDSELRGQEEV